MALFDRDWQDIYSGFDGKRAPIEQSPQIDALKTSTIPRRDWRPTPPWLDRARKSPLIQSRLSGMEPSSFGAVHVNSVNFPNIELEHIGKFESDQENDQQWTTEKYYTPRSTKDNLRELDPATLYAADILMLQRPITCPGTNYALYTKPDIEKGQSWKNPKGFNQIKGEPDLSRISVNPHPQLSTLPRR